MRRSHPAPAEMAYRMKCAGCGRGLEDKEAHLLVGMVCKSCLSRGEQISFQVRPATSSEDSKFVLSFLDNLFGETEFIEFGRWYRVEEMEKIVAVGNGGKHLGFAVYSLEDDEPGLMTLLTINVDESFLRRGVASTLLEEVKKIAARSGIDRIRVPISNDDLLSYVFYHRRGFRLTGIDLGLCVKRHGGEVEGCWQLPLRDEFYLVCDLG